MHPVRQETKVAGSLSRITNLNLTDEKKKLMENSVFHKLVHINHARQGFAPLDSALCSFYDPKNHCFVFNDQTSFSFCTKEVADVLGIQDGGNNDYNLFSKDCEIPSFLEILKTEHGVGGGSFQPKDLRQILRDMRVDDEERKLWFKKLMSYYLVDQLLLCSSNVKLVRKRLWKVVEDLEIFNDINWAKAVHGHIHKALRDLKEKKEKAGEHIFTGAPLAFEAIVFERIPSLRPEVEPGSVDPPIQKYKSQRKKTYKELAKLSPEMINECSYCSSQGLGLMEEGDCSVARSLQEDVAEVAEEEDGVSSVPCRSLYLVDFQGLSLEEGRSSREDAVSYEVEEEDGGSLAPSLSEDVAEEEDAGPCVVASLQGDAAQRRSTRTRKGRTIYSPSDYHVGKRKCAPKIKK